MEANIWFYTFSTSAQVMASIVGLFSVFVVYKIQDFNDTLNEARQAIIKIISSYSLNTNGYSKIYPQNLISENDYVVLGKFYELLKIKTEQPNRMSFEKTVSGTTIVYALNDYTHVFFVKLLNRKEKIFKQLKSVLFLFLLNISISMVALILTKYLIEFKLFIYLAMTFSIFCLYKVGRSIYNITSE